MNIIVNIILMDLSRRLMGMALTIRRELVLLKRLLRKALGHGMSPRALSSRH